MSDEKWLEEQIDSLNLTLQTSISEVQKRINSVSSTLPSLVNIRNLMYVFIATTVIFIIATVHLATKTKVFKGKT